MFLSEGLEMELKSNENWVENNINFRTRVIGVLFTTIHSTALAKFVKRVFGSWHEEIVFELTLFLIICVYGSNNFIRILMKSFLKILFCFHYLIKIWSFKIEFRDVFEVGSWFSNHFLEKEWELELKNTLAIDVSSEWDFVVLE